MCKRAREVVESRCDLPLRRRRKELEIYILREVKLYPNSNEQTRERAERDARAERERNAHVALAAGFVFFLFSQVSKRPLLCLPTSPSLELFVCFPSGSKKKRKSSSQILIK
jgi:hypothetical protein